MLSSKKLTATRPGSPPLMLAAVLELRTAMLAMAVITLLRISATDVAAAALLPLLLAAAPPKPFCSGDDVATEAHARLP